MDTSEQKASIWSVGLSIFAMFFGAGNIVFPLALGQFTLDKNFYGILGLLITAVLVPLAGLLAMLLYGGDYQAFFRRIGKIPGFTIVVLILALIGPFGGIPRCITVSYSTLEAFKMTGPEGIGLTLFSLLSCVALFLFTYRPRRILTWLGYVLTPILLLSLGAIIVKGLWLMPEADHTLSGKWQTFSHGVLEGYNTMDLLASFFFSSVVLLCLQQGKLSEAKGNKKMISVALVGSLIAALLLALVYVSLSYIAAGYSSELTSVQGHQMLGTLAHHLLGAKAGLLTGLAVLFACMTTEIALTAVFARFLHEILFPGKLSFPLSIGLTLVAAFFISTFRFEGISSFIVPILQVCYPALIVLTLLNILYKLLNFQPVKFPFYATFALSIVLYALLK